MKRSAFVLVGLVAAITLCGAPAVARADANNFAITSFTADDTLTNADPQGQLHIVERINVTFYEYNHGLLRAIPNTYKHHQLQMHINSIASDTHAPTQFTTYTQNGNTVLKIGDPARTLTGGQEYTIDYTLRNVITFYADHDELYWDINGDQWPQTFNFVRVTLHLPAGLRLLKRAPLCYTGATGSLAHDCIVSRPAPTMLISQTTNGLGGYQTLSIVAGFDKGFFHPAKWYETLAEYTRPAVAFLVPSLLLAGAMGIFWWRRGRDPKGRGVIVPEYNAPAGLRPLEVGTIADFRTDNCDITATIIDLAIRRYITIIEQKQDRKLLRRDFTTYLLRLEKTDWSSLNPYEQAVLEAFFGGKSAGEQVDLAAMKYKLNATATWLRRSVRRDLTADGYFRPNPITFRNVLVGVAAVVLLFVLSTATGQLGSPVGFGLGFATGAALGLLFLLFLSSRTPKGVAAKEHILGLKMYLEVAEADRLKKLQSPDASYASKTDAPAHTVELFEKLLPYAMVLGVEQQWAKQFQDIYRTPPDWYSGNWSTFSVLYLASSLNSGIASQVNSAFSAPSSSSGSGFGGGGAGGGGGGGGGGGW